MHGGAKVASLGKRSLLASSRHLFGWCSHKPRMSLRLNAAHAQVCLKQRCQALSSSTSSWRVHVPRNIREPRQLRSQLPQLIALIERCSVRRSSRERASPLGGAARARRSRRTSAQTLTHSAAGSVPRTTNPPKVLPSWFSLSAAQSGAVPWSRALRDASWSPSYAPSVRRRSP